jgi:hypothetical protein
MRTSLLALAVAVGMSGVVLGANVHFAESGGTALTDLNVQQGDGPVSFELWVDLHAGESMSEGTVNCSNSDAALLPLTNVFVYNPPAFQPPFPFDGYAEFLFTYGLGGPVGPIATLEATFDIDTQGLAPGDYVLTASHPSTVIKDLVGMPLATTATDLTIHVLPEPVTVVLLGLGGLIGLRRNRA